MGWAWTKYLSQIAMETLITFCTTTFFSKGTTALHKEMQNILRGFEPLGRTFDFCSRGRKKRYQESLL
jgi:hypothetical protein